MDRRRDQPDRMSWVDLIALHWRALSQCKQQRNQTEPGALETDLIRPDSAELSGARCDQVNATHPCVVVTYHFIIGRVGLYEIMILRTKCTVVR